MGWHNRLASLRSGVAQKGDFPVAGTSLLALLDDIATILDDVAVMSKVAIKKTSGVLGDDLALNAEQVTGIKPDREIPVVLAVAKGSALNKLILVPSALAISAFIPWAVTPLLMAGGLFLCYEGSEKIYHKLQTAGPNAALQEHESLLKAVADQTVDLVAYERGKIKGAIRTDFILSAEIIVITLGTVATAPFQQQLLVLSVIGILMTIGVYGLVAGIVKLDDLGLYLGANQEASWTGRAKRSLGSMLLRFAPWLLKFLSVAGMIAMFLVGGGIISHGVPLLHHWTEAVDQHAFSGMGAVVSGLIGLVCGAVVVGVVNLFKKFRKT